ncbi:hypothetical protein NSB25_26750 [Acetatifactor muris]|uniref:Uncharacterized protein n=1 Tax=Acetatifactor muris TaxID=879566 RepID=A0A2K4ZPC9_9FIRM|nr:hypothetical protein [Acetatifactor muris]MCR2050834.1 hypothetical protein [Acetatifactor muris]SOY32348.1 hypothetical protein AMURIS_05106 [Acetatifactor muris]
MSDNLSNTSLQHEKLKLHYRYLVIIALILLLGSVVLAAYNQNAFVSQVSFAGTITSIILSVIAIWMSISGERSTNDIRNKIAESTERLSCTTQNVETLNQKYEKTMDTQLEELKNVQEQLTKVIYSINSVGEQVSHLQENNITVSNASNNNIFDSSQKIALFNNIYNWVLNVGTDTEWLFCNMVYFFISHYKSGTQFNYNNVIFDLSCHGININYWIRTIDIYWGVLNTLSAASVFADDATVNQIYNKVNSKINPIAP